jgi:hypothetical protein
MYTFGISTALSTEKPDTIEVGSAGFPKVVDISENKV